MTLLLKCHPCESRVLKKCHCEGKVLVLGLRLKGRHCEKVLADEAIPLLITFLDCFVATKVAPRNDVRYQRGERTSVRIKVKRRSLRGGISRQSNSVTLCGLPRPLRGLAMTR